MKCLSQEAPGVGTPPLNSQVFKSLRNTRHGSSILRCFSQNNSLLMHHSCDIKWLCFCLDLEGIKNTCTTLYQVKLVVEGGGDKKKKKKGKVWIYIGREATTGTRSTWHPSTRPRHNAPLATHLVKTLCGREESTNKHVATYLKWRSLTA